MKYHVHPSSRGSGGVVEGREGTGVSADGEVMRLPAGWTATEDMEASGYEIRTGEPPPIPEGYEPDGDEALAVRGGSLVWNLRPLPSPPPTPDIANEIVAGFLATNPTLNPPETAVIAWDPVAGTIVNK